MPNEEWGVKRICPTTGKRFYDLNKTPIVSPYTGEVVEIEDSFRKGVGSAGARATSEKTEKLKAKTSSDDDDLLDDDDTPDDSDIDDDLLEDDDDDTVSLDDLADVGGEDDES
ncbi:TIGR02300 family protein [Acidimangrovimonas sediminis]|uniref:TIGR02300 family protein n=1 Tax=Acidimangrovimonas sediminis TaxID=2056283 RepID=UPI000C80E07E|nr:TIGR02300 family protein [Acidimangrovimonas sediminis]